MTWRNGLKLGSKIYNTCTCLYFVGVLCELATNPLGVYVISLTYFKTTSLYTIMICTCARDFNIICWTKTINNVMLYCNYLTLG